MTNDFELTVPDLYLLTVQEAPKAYNSLMDQIWAKYEHLDSGEFGAVGTTGKERHFAQNL